MTKSLGNVTVDRLSWDRFLRHEEFGMRNGIERDATVQLNCSDDTQFRDLHFFISHLANIKLYRVSSYPQKQRKKDTSSHTPRGIHRICIAFPPSTHNTSSQTIPPFLSPSIATSSSSSWSSWADCLGGGKSDQIWIEPLVSGGHLSNILGWSDRWERVEMARYCVFSNS